ncbi:peptidase inhibitor family I36 protein [Streptacidiphilus neutrinimicus]|uniref:peptidase inhibitor family I36 protein n=1 Tax=Streptacidiphilus neutrinimicus TaxID=105420 RepID=UPI000694F523|nr:peptidase inhibitor family I36 protein [Streptacidiphilus neutrinimicus]
MRTIKLSRRTTGFASALAVAAAVTLLGTTTPAYAAGPGGAEACPSGSFCLYYNSPGVGWGSFEHWSPGSFSDLSQYFFRDWGNGSGYGQTVYKNAASVVNNTSLSWNICVPAPPPDNMNCGIPIAPGYAGSLPSAAHNEDVAMFIN